MRTRGAATPDSPRERPPDVIHAHYSHHRGDHASRNDGFLSSPRSTAATSATCAGRCRSRGSSPSATTPIFVSTDPRGANRVAGHRGDPRRGQFRVVRDPAARRGEAPARLARGRNVCAAAWIPLEPGERGGNVRRGRRGAGRGGRGRTARLLALAGGGRPERLERPAGHIGFGGVTGHRQGGIACGTPW